MALAQISPTFFPVWWWSSCCWHQSQSLWDMLYLIHDCFIRVVYEGGRRPTSI